MAAGGCRSAGRGPIGPPLAFPDAIAIVNENAAQVGGTLRATGHVDGHFTVEGRRRSFHLDGVLFYLHPRCLRFDLKSLGQRRVLLGSNERQYWFCHAEEDICQCGTHGQRDKLEDEIPLLPEEVIEAFGLGGIPNAAGHGPPPSQRVLGEYQRVLFATLSDADASPAQREYWLDRRAPRLIRRIIFRGPSGEARVQSSLGDYRRLSGDGPWLPHSLSAQWPATGAEIRFRVSRWTLVPEVGPDGPQFGTPPECRDPRQGYRP